MATKKKPAPKKPAAKRAAAKKPAPRKPAPKKLAAPAKKPASRAKIAKAVEPPRPAKAHPLVAELQSKTAKARVAAAHQASALGPKAPPELAQALVRALQNPDRETRKAASEALVRLGPVGVSALAELAPRVGSGHELPRRAAMAIELAKLDRDHLPAALPVLAELVAVGAANEASLVQEVIDLVPALGLHALPLLPALVQRLEVTEGAEADAIVSAIRSAGPLGADAVAKAASESSGPFGAQLVRLLDAYDVAEHTLALGELSHHPDLQVRLAAVEALGRRRSREAVPHLLKALQDPSREVPATAQAALRNFSADAVRPVLSAFLLRLRQDAPEQRNRAVVISSELGVAGFDDIGPLLLDALGDDDASIRLRAAQGLHAVADDARAALPRLRNQRRDSSDQVRAAVEAAINAIEHAERHG